ncbi:MAG TPA: FtsX-like permease family protein, partial [Bryobacteraceae bacterium]|nr:FtsX-like permease family protein [Bryobacteraceae bacterium]
RQLLTESMIVAAAAATLGFLAAGWLMHAMSRLRMPFPMPVGYDFQPDGRVLLWAIALMVFTGLAFGLAPALQATRTDLLPALKEGGTVLVRRHRRLSLRNLLIVSQVAGTLTLLTVLGFSSFGIQTTLGVQAGFDLRNLYLVSLDPVRDGYSAEQSAALLEKLLERVKALSAITSATLTQSVPVSMPGSPLRILRPGDRAGLNALKHVVGRDYFVTTGIPILRGRGFRKEDETEPGKVIVSEALARQFWPAQDPVGRTFEIGDAPPGPPPLATLPWTAGERPSALAGGRRVFEVMGVVRDVAEGLTVQKPRPTIYFPLSPGDYRQPLLSGITLIVRAAPGTDALTAVQRELATLDSRLTPFDARSMQDQIYRFMTPLHVASWSYGFMWVFGLILAAVGLAGVTAYAVTHRRHEIGIRMALGAQKRDVLGLVMKDGAILIAAGMALGGAAAWAISRALAAFNATAGQITSTSTSDPAVIFGAPAMLAVLALIACYVPARRSLRIDPIVTLRQE